MDPYTASSVPWSSACAGISLAPPKLSSSSEKLWSRVSPRLPMMVEGRAKELIAVDGRKPLPLPNGGRWFICRKLSMKRDIRIGVNLFDQSEVL